MFSIFSSSAGDQITLMAVFCLGLLAGGAVVFQRMSAQNRRLSDALNNMSQGLCMFDAQGRITLFNHRYLEMYRLDPKVVKIGITLRQLIEHRKATGLFTGDVDQYVRKIMDGMKTGKSEGHIVPAADGRMVLAKNERMPDGGWVSTHEDVTEQRRAEEERAALRDQEQRRSAIDAAIAAFRPKVENLLSSVSDNAISLGNTASSLFSASGQTTQRAEMVQLDKIRHRARGRNGLPPVEWRGEIRASCGCTHGDPFHAGPRLGRGAIADGRVQTLPIVEDFDVFEHGRLRLLAGAEADLVDVLGLERGEEALHGRVIEAVAAAAHGLRDAVPLQHRPVGLGRVLHAAVAVVDQPA